MYTDSKKICATLGAWPLGEYESFNECISIILFKLGLIPAYILGSLVVIIFTNFYRIIHRNHQYITLDSDETRALNQDNSNYGTLSSGNQSNKTMEDSEPKYSRTYIKTPQAHNSKLIWISFIHVIILSLRATLTFIYGYNSGFSSTIYESLLTTAFWSYATILAVLNQNFTFLNHLKGFYLISFLVDCFYLRTLIYSTNFSIPSNINYILQTLTCVIELSLVLYSFLMNINLAEFNKLALKSKIYPSPEPYESLLSIATFSWVIPFLRYGYNSSIEPNDVWDLRPDEKAASLCQKFLDFPKEWSFIFKIFSNFKQELFMQMVFSLFTICFNFLSPILLHEFLQLMENTDKELPLGLKYKEYGFYVIVCLLVVVMLKSITDSQSLFYGRRVGIRVKSIVMGEVYSKTLRRKDISSQKEDSKVSNAGKITNFMSVDAHEIAETCCYLNFLYSVPIQIGVTSWYLYQILGWSALVGLLLTFIVMPINYVVSMKWEKIQTELMKCSDKRMDIVNELLQGIRIIKFFAWEGQFRGRIDSARTAELQVLIKRMAIWIVGATVWFCFPMLITIGTFYTYTKIAGNVLTPTIAFTSLLIFKFLREPVDQLPDIINYFLQAKVSLGRIDKFLKEPETEKFQILKEPENPDDPIIGFKNAKLQWDSSEEGDQFTLSNLNLSFPLNKLSIIVGPTGSGKTSLLSGLLGEMSILEGSVYLPRKSNIESTTCTKDFSLNGGIAYVIQSAWIQQDTVRNNILFGEPYNEARYQEVIKVCALLPDFNSLEDGDLTEVGEKGITLSGGQKQRLSLARAVYSRASHIIMDDCLSALDAHTAKFIFHNCFMGDIMKNRTRILVTHNISLTFYHAEYVVVLNSQGEVIANGSRKDVESIPSIKAELNMFEDQSHKESIVSESHGATSRFDTGSYLPPNLEVTNPKKLVLEEERAKGAVKFEIYSSYFKASGGNIYWFGFLGIFVIYQTLPAVLDWWIKIWANAGDKIPDTNGLQLNSFIYMSFDALPIKQLYEAVTHPIVEFYTKSVLTLKSNNDLDYYINIYIIISAMSVLTVILRVSYQFWGSIKASRILHDSLLDNILHAPIRFFDTTPVGRLINRFSKDLQCIDQELMASSGVFVSEIFASIIILSMIAFILPQFLVAALIILMMFYYVIQFYIGGSREIKRIESVSRSPIYAQCGETLQGVTTIRAYEQVTRFRDTNYEKIDDNIRCFFYLWTANRWLSIRSDLVGGIVTFATGSLLLLFSEQLNSALIGLALSYALNFSSHILWIARFYSMIEMNMNSIERIQEYLDVPSEPPRKIPSNCPPPKWPTEGKIEINNLILRYAPDRDPVIKGISLSIKGGEKIGIVGRTGAGKSTLALAFFRFVDPEKGSIYIDDIDIHKIGLFDLRSNLTIIPQDAILFSGTIRSNLDPFNQYEDQQLWNSLRRVHLIDNESPIYDLPEETNTVIKSLDQVVTENGQNFSQGQRQLLSLARALLKQSKVIIMDEATASVDYTTGVKIQKTIRQELSQSTLLCIAHRLRSIIDYDKVVVMDHGIIKEFDSPANLIKQEDSLFRAMCKESGDFETLEQMAQNSFINDA